MTGGARSGRSAYALRRAAELGPPPWLYMTGGQETDEAIRKRAERTRRESEAIWRTGVLTSDLSTLSTLIETAKKDGVGALVLDGFVPWLSKRLAAAPAAEAELLAEVQEFAERLARGSLPALVVTQEVGHGIPHINPDTPEYRLLRLVGHANQMLANEATGLVMMVCGVPLRVR
ncbi:MAG TPA: bifunctional adenosylcobinamide kinase/adenosylcobinamide-phosphate guanylyltransferase [Polyangia bacterium]